MVDNKRLFYCLIVFVCGIHFSVATLNVTEFLKKYSNGSTELTCPNGFGPYNGNCYYIGSGQISWASARETCHQINSKSELTSIHNVFEQAFLAELAQGAPTWIGLLNEGGAWAWIDNTPYDYYDWAQGQPDGSGYCGELWPSGNMKWDDYFCMDSSGFITQYICKISGAQML